MSRIGKKLTVVGIWAGIGILIGLQFGGGSGPSNSQILPGYSKGTGTVQSVQTPGAAPGQGQGVAQGGQAYVYVPVAVDPATGAYTLMPSAGGLGAGSGNTPDSADLPQEEAEDYSTLTPEQILIPEEEGRAVDVLADKTAGLLQQASQKGIRWVVSLFDSAEE
ncbi:hypothetical protein C2I18_04975 [Paenibacillus sp. PK3_47]|uniref:hypothetical protein n=1 Tax=Paenibacillus sp. PK3_47 TaxID=2072642 RepID=UPI00201E6A5D|nr:hypothetical protein [Paenibacillus sp. PK3_47]UQZ32970.1 hypothetical protein C2I18_04975 [Paenibacillus sp. PK3_47]